jgi:hypothetical protein
MLNFLIKCHSYNFNTLLKLPQGAKNIINLNPEQIQQFRMQQMRAQLNQQQQQQQQQPQYINIQQANPNMIQQQQQSQQPQQQMGNPQFIQAQIQQHPQPPQQQMIITNLNQVNPNIRANIVQQQQHQPQIIHMQQQNMNRNIQMDHSGLAQQQIGVQQQQPQYIQQQPVPTTSMVQQTLSPQAMINNTGSTNEEEELYNRKIEELKRNHLPRLEKIVANSQSKFFKKLNAIFFRLVRKNDNNLSNWKQNGFEESVIS